MEIAAARQPRARELHYDNVRSAMAEEGVLAFEVGIHQAEAVQQLCLEAGFAKTSVRKDYAGIERMVFAVKAAETTPEAMARYEAMLAEAAREL